MLLSLYFTEFSHFWPLLHRGRFFNAVKQQPLELLCSVALIGTLHQSDIDEHDGKSIQKPAARSVHEWLLSHLSAYLNQRREEGPAGSLPSHCAADLAAAQALLLSIIYGVCVDQVSLRVRLSSAFHTITGYLRDANLLQHPHLLPADPDEHSRWLAVESTKRLVFAAFRLDAYLSLFYDARPPTLRFQEIAVPLPCSDALWDAADAAAWRGARQLEPNGRQRRTFSALCAAAFAGAPRDAMPVLLEEDYEVALCAMQARLWEDARVRHEQGASGGAAQACQAQLEYWRTHRDRSRLLNAHYSAPAHRRRVRFNGTMLYLLSYLRMHADVPLIRRLVAGLDQLRGGPGPAAAAVAPRRLESQVAAWAASRSARVALRCAAQICQLYRQEADCAASMLQRIDPVGVGCVFRAALVVWAYARSTLSCEVCVGFSAEFSEDGQSSFFGPQAFPIRL
ncbi:putative C2H2 transcription factor (AmdX) [Neofusicoccum parvum]|uniref:C2H2 transcription factor (AmdX) n=1 Tax=Neofusicoccum parvum TaxID=310453 RepID=A0ACB5SF80_9PEZI|nr:putative C2H2 transcription factor (AmdX) [Neofusicoccum parvum]